MTSIVFVTIADLSGRRGDSMATRDLVVALATRSSVPVKVICPDPERELPSQVIDAVDAFHFLPSKSGAGDPRWHARTEYQILKQLLRVRSRDSVARVITRLYATTITPLTFCKLFDVRYTLLVRGWVNRTHKGGDMSYPGVVERIMERNVRHADDVYVAFDALREWLSDYRGSSRSEIQVLPNAVDPDVFEPSEARHVRDQFDVQDDDFVVGFVGSLEPRHMLRELLEGTAETDAHVVIVGDGPQRTRLERIAENQGMTARVHFAGFVPHESVGTYISAFDVGYGVVHPEKPSNPIKCYEYLACGTPVITSRTPELQFVEENGFGVVLDDSTPDSVAEAIEKLTVMGGERREVLGNRARRYVTDNCTWEGIAAEILGQTGANGVTRKPS
jgi:glycosyltransferase involved in cell wall biosynthesis